MDNGASQGGASEAEARPWAGGAIGLIKPVIAKKKNRKPA